MQQRRKSLSNLLHRFSQFNFTSSSSADSKLTPTPAANQLWVFSVKAFQPRLTLSCTAANKTVLHFIYVFTHLSESAAGWIAAVGRLRVSLEPQLIQLVQTSEQMLALTKGSDAEPEPVSSDSLPGLSVCVSSLWTSVCLICLTNWR